LAIKCTPEVHQAIRKDIKDRISDGISTIPAAERPAILDFCEEVKKKYAL